MRTGLLWSLLAQAVLLAHLAFVLWVAAGGLLVLRRPRLAWLHLPAVAWGVAVELGGWICPLTHLENRLRHAAGEQGYAGDFVSHYLLAVLYPDGLTRELQWLLAAAVLTVNAGVYAAWLQRRRIVGPQPTRRAARRGRRACEAR